MALERYDQKRNFKKTPEPKPALPRPSKNGKELIFVVQKHNASHLHYDFRLESGGVLKSWAVPKGPSLNPDDKRLAMMVEDHPFSYKDFEGIIPEGNYGAGQVIVWDKGTYQPLLEYSGAATIEEAIRNGKFGFELNGKKLKGQFSLVKMKFGKGKDNSWLLIKKKDLYATSDDVTKRDLSVISGKNISQMTPEESAIYGQRAYTKTKTNSSDFKIDKSLKAKMPTGFIHPMLATLVDEPFDREGWLFEMKWDGFRAIAQVHKRKVHLYSRNQLSFNSKFSLIVDALKKVPFDVVFDGEVAAVDESGIPSFQLLQNYIKTGQGSLIYYVFDVLYFDGYDLRSLPLIERKKILQGVLPQNDHIKFSDHVETKGRQLFKLVREKNIEGIIAKDASSLYEAGKRSRSWLKIKVQKRQEAIICGITEPRGGRKKFGALILGVYGEEKELKYIGHTGGGFDEQSLGEVYSKLKPLLTDKCPFKKAPKTNAPVTWVKPKLLCEVKFSEWTDEGMMRQPIFIALRQDKNPQDVKKEKEFHTKTELKKKTVENENPVGRQEAVMETKPRIYKIKSTGTEIGEKIKFKATHLDKIYFPGDQYTKGDVIEYYRKIAPMILPYLKDRPQSLHRHPNGIKEDSFFQKNMENIPDWIQTQKIYSESDDKYINYMLCQDVDSLLYMANLGSIEINVWNSRIQHLKKPDYLVLDLDPLHIGFSKVIETAQALREILESLDMNSFPKTSGATGLHIYVPLEAKYTHEQSQQFTHLLCKIVNAQLPKITDLDRNPKKREKKVYCDFLQNRYAQTMVSAYCLRPRPQAPVSTPLKWAEVNSKLDPEKFNIKTIFKRLDQVGDLWKGVLGKGMNMSEAIKKMDKLYAQKISK